MTLRRVALGITEEAIFLLRSTYWDAVNSPQQRMNGRIGRRQSELSSSNSFSKEATYLRLVSIVEVFVDAANGMRFASYTDGQEGGALRTLVAVAQNQSNLTWDKRRQNFEEYHGIYFRETQAWVEFETAIKVRNSIAHRLGRVERMNHQTRAEFQLIEVRVLGQAILIDQRSLDRCLELSIKFVSDLDALLRCR